MSLAARAAGGSGVRAVVKFMADLVTKKLVESPAQAKKSAMHVRVTTTA